MKHALTLVAVSGIVLLTFLFAMQTASRDQRVPAADDTSGSHWRERIAQAGGAEAYGEFSEFVHGLSISRQHELAHVFGGALFEAEDTRGLSVCDAQFSYGCFHEFLGRAIASYGLSTVPDLNEGCTKSLVESPLSCQHGIGHGVLAFLGYSEGDLLEALDVCEHLPYNDPIGGCYGGAFMEYNLRTMLGVDGTVRDISKNVHDPCDGLGGAFKSPCVYWQPQLWFHALFSGQATAEAYAQMGDYCREIASTPTLQRACFEGLGTITAQAAGYEPLRVADLCNTAAENIKEHLYCTSLAANSMGIEVDVETAEKACLDFSAENKEYCLAYAHNEANILNVRLAP